ncbi:hypothetical protein ZWY2020_015432 [Hordeum vulgare]|nr:hypothetical protein ZWY2020_015431 [Hordeum vulgare]KAI4978679.1 hypothetical protein ZWY2020_015432 [Hordeum vulgare]
MPQILVKWVTRTEKTFAVEVERGGDTTVEEVKRKIHAMEGFLPREQRMVFAGKQGRDGETLADCGVSFGADGDAATPPLLYLVIWSYSLGRFVYWERHVDMAARAGRSSGQD